MAATAATADSCWAVLSGTVPLPAVVVMVLHPVVMIQLPDGLLLQLLALLAIELLAAIIAAAAAAAAASDGELQLLLLLVWLLLALETCVSGSVCCNNSVFLSCDNSGWCGGGCGVGADACVFGYVIAQMFFLARQER